ncbi:MAG: PilZ domain-containing protein [Melioribacteraceae bacterium]|jgi:hypothetical protein|nr:PilZ domain-containing protein [Melioribacteraceae bacterium]
MKFSERRKHKRFDIFDSKLHVLDTTKGDSLLEGTIDNFSRYGLCIMTEKPFRKGQKITIKDEFIALPQPATVRWSKKYKDDHYKAGLELMTLKNNGI